ncbi:TonB-dependent siderophore receptor [Grimontia kaedaensis]|uniref:TonB-dependent siderophore receptor n=1 Tax=Grimontia kaedaensis TaxID=2872157 RepID=A0ABY4X036_9GAMM|nr:TonB-dependent siderophore receptor [Grimontia kaedaensis]USH04624.1 TonB-dependent siderophore receptor [Grimontia kaedaensis]
MELKITAAFKPTALASAVMAALSTPVLAETQAEEEMVVWGTRVTSNSEQLLSDDFALKQADHMSDLLREIPGVDVGGTHSVNQRINIRGLGEDDLDIRLDGASQHANMFHHIGNLTLNPDILKSADIQVGNNSVVQNGLGGSVYFETKDALDLLRYDENYGLRVHGGLASNKSQQGSLTAYGLLTEHIDMMLYTHLISRDNFEDGNGQETFGSEGDVLNGLFKVGYQINDEQRLQFAYDAYRDEGDYSVRPDMSGDANQIFSGDSLVPTKYDRDTITLSYKLSGEAHNGKVALYSSKTEIDRDESVLAPQWRPNRTSRNKADNHNLGLNIQFQSDFKLAGLENTLTYGTDYIDRNTTSSYGGEQFMDETTISTAIFVEDNIAVTDSITLVAGLRYDDYQRKAETSDTDYDDITWSLGAEWAVSEEWTLFANTRSLFKGPELLESYIRYQDVTFLADDIKPETGSNTQGGFRFATQHGAHQFGANATVFQTKINDYIAESYSRTDDNYLIENIGDVKLEGFEISSTYAYQTFSGKLSYSRSDIENVTTGGPVLAGNGRSMDTGDTIVLALNYYSSDIETLFGWTSFFVQDEDNVQDGQPIKEGYNVHNLYAQWAPSSVDSLTLTFGIDNVFDELYVAHASRSGEGRGATFDDYEPGRNVKLSASYQF